MTPIDQLRATKEKLPVALREQILALGAEAVAPLLAILDDGELETPESPGEGWPPIHAVELLADLEAPEAVEPMLDVLVETDFDHVIHDRLLARLPAFGAAVLEPALARLAETEDVDVAHSLTAVLGKLGVKDERIFDAICDVFDEDLAYGAFCFADYGDVRAVPMLEGAIIGFEPDFSTAAWRYELTEVLDAHRELGAVLPDDLRAHVDALDESWKAHSALAKRGGGQKVGRNDACPCQSGKKYKKCCLGKAAAGPAKQFVDFAQPLLDSTDRSKAETESALALARFFWDVALTRDSEEREALIAEMLYEMPTAAERDAFAELALNMLDRHREMFPELHQRPA